MAFPNGTIPTEVPVHPTPLYELGLSLLAFAILWRLRRRPRPQGWMFALFMLLQGVERVVAEVWRLNPPVLWRLSDAQLIALASCIVGVVWLIRLRGQSPEQPSATQGRAG